jgi:glutamate transport system permease protein
MGGTALTPVLYDHPGPRARRRNAILTAVLGAGLLALLWYGYRRFDRHGQWAAAKWQPFTEAGVWTGFLLPGLVETLRAAAVGMVLALGFGLVFAVGRLSVRRWIGIPVGAVVEFCRAVPLLLMIFFVFYGLPFLLQAPVPAFWAVVAGLTLYNGSVLAEALRSGIRSVPSGQSEAAYALGMRKAGVMRHVLVPQTARTMLPIIVSQLVVLLKDTALGYLIAYPELLQRASEVVANRGNLVAVFIVVAGMYIAVNATLTAVAGWLDRHTRRGTRTGRAQAQPPVPVT